MGGPWVVEPGLALAAPAAKPHLAAGLAAGAESSPGASLGWLLRETQRLETFGACWVQMSWTQPPGSVPGNAVRLSILSGSFLEAWSLGWEGFLVITHSSLSLVRKT